MELSRQEYPALLRSLPPSQAITILDERVRLIGRINADIGDWLSERRKVEESYVQGLRKLANRRPTEALEQLGIFQGPWQSIVGSVETLADSHSTLATEIEVDVERPLKEYQTKNREMQGISTIQGNIVSIAKEVDNALKKASKISAGKSSATKVANATSDVEAANQQWESQAPYVFEQLQALDESRVNHLRDVLTQLETHEVDQVERNRATAESCLNALLSIDTKDEISTFVARYAAVDIPNGTRQDSRGGGAIAPPAATSVAATTSPEPPSIRSTPSRPSASANNDVPIDRPSPFASSTRSATEAAPPPPPPKRSGLRRLGTVLSRPNKSSKNTERASSPEKKPRISRNPLRRGPSSRQDMQAIPSPPRTSASNKPSSPPQLDAPTFGASSGLSTDRPSTPPTTTGRETQLNGDAIDQTPKRISSLPVTNGIQANREPLPAQEASASPPNKSETNRDADGFNVPPSGVDDITLAQQEAAATGEPDQPAFKLNIQSQPIQEDPDAQSAFSSVANTLRAQASQVATPRKASTNRGRRDVRNTVFVPSGGSIDSIGGSPTPAVPPFNIGSHPSPATETSRGTDTQSIRSAYSMNSIAHPTVSHPHMQQPGLNVSIVETVSATFTDTQVTKAVVIGELALQHNASNDATSTGSENVRLENFAVLEKVAPNPAFITQKPAASGEYSVDVADLSRPTVAFKYQVHLDESNLVAHAPISLTPSWKIEPSQTSVIVTYALNPGFVLPGKRSVSLKNVMVFVTIENAKAQSCQSKPVGIFSKEKSLIYWKLGDITLDADSQAPQKLLARFVTDGEAKAGSVESRWEISGEQANGLGSGLSLSLISAGKDEGGGSDPFADESTEKSAVNGRKEVPTSKRIISGRYIAS